MSRRLTVVAAAVLVYLAVAGLFVIAVGGVGRRGEGGGAPLFGPRVAIVELEGVIIDVDDVVQELKGLRENPSVRAVVMRINSPGGVVGPTQEVHDAILRLRRAGKPVVASLARSRPRAATTSPWPPIRSTPTPARSPAPSA